MEDDPLTEEELARYPWLALAKKYLEPGLNPGIEEIQGSIERGWGEHSAEKLRHFDGEKRACLPPISTPPSCRDDAQETWKDPGLMKTLPRRATWCLAGLLVLAMLAGIWWLSIASDIPFRVGTTMEEVEVETMVIQLTADGAVGGRYNGSEESVGLSVPVFR